MTYSKAKAAWERDFFFHGLTICNGNVSEVSRRCRLGRRALASKLRRLGLRPADFRVDGTPKRYHTNWYKKLQANPQRYAAYLEKKAAYRRKRHEQANVS